MPVLQVKSYLSGNPAIAIALNDSLVIGRREGSQNDYGGYGRWAGASSYRCLMCYQPNHALTSGCFASACSESSAELLYSLALPNACGPW